MKKIILILYCLAFINASFGQTISLSQISPEVHCTSGIDSFNISWNNAIAGSNIVLYQSTNPNFNPYNGEGDSIDFIHIDATSTSSTNQITSTCPRIVGIFIDACNEPPRSEPANEYMILTSGNAGFLPSSLQIDLPANKDINLGSNPCTFQTPSAALMTLLRIGACNTLTLIPAGPSDFIPANAIVIVFTGNGTDYPYNFSGFCNLGQPVYILQNACTQGVSNGSFVNNGNPVCANLSGARYRTTSIKVGSCRDALSYDRCGLQDYDIGNPNAGDGNYVIHLENTDTSSVANGGIKNNKLDKCNGIELDSIIGSKVIALKIPNGVPANGSIGGNNNFCNTGYHYIKAITNPAGTQPVSNAIKFKLVCLDLTATPTTNTICSGQNAVVNNSSGDANAAFSWTVSGGGNITGASTGSGAQINQTLTNTGTTKDSVTYSITAKDEICSVNKTVKIIVNPILPKPNLGNDTTICGAISKVLSTGNATTVWTLNNNPLASNTASITATLVGQYIATISGGCNNVADTINISQTTTEPKPNLGKDTSFCGAFSLPLTTGIATTNWFRDNVALANNTASIIATQTGTYRAVVTGTCGSASDTIVITASPDINFDFGTNSTTVCNGNSISLDASTAYDRYIWSTGAVTHSISVTTPDKYWVDVFKGSCKGTDTIIVTEIQPPVKPNLGNDTAFCGTFSKALTTGNNATTWFKDLVQIATNTPTINATQAGTYIASITNSCATAKDTIVISQTSTQTKPNLGNDTTFCGAASKTLTTGNATTTWFRDNVQIATNTVTITATQAGQYIAAITGSCGDVSDTIVISESASASKPFIGSDTTYCGDFSRVLTTGNAQTNWIRNNVAITTAASITITQGGTYVATVIGACGNASDTIVINNANALSFNLGNDTVLCAGQTLVLNATVPGSGITYTWNTGELTPKITVPAQFKRYDVVVSNGICSVADTIIVDSTGRPNKPSLGNDTAFCGDFSIQLFTGENTFWSTGETGISILVTKAGQYIAENKNVCGSAKDTIVLTKFALPKVNLGRDTSFCDSINLTVGNGIFNSILWSTNDTLKSIIVTLPNLYTVKVTNVNCFKIDSINITRDCDYDVYLPTAFSPNNDNVNDILVPLSNIKGIEVLDFVIFNRWSEKVFEAHNFAPNDKLFGWNGTFKGEQSAVDHYAFYYFIKLQDGKTKSYKGTFALVK